ncbi:O-antigen ligase family protein [Anaerocolumna aminovalerica]|uniref:O-antigen ligase family protein n=1 Tax=Anaerocolumna aminovalerica TaxID=1527 RepID=UPI00248C4750|nr:O-antigen ligase family protein [Anaerocolumna aminovalerica]
MNTKRIHCAEIIAAFYINSFIILKPLLNRYSYISTVILTLEIVAMLLIYLISYRFRFNRDNFFKMITLLVCVSLVFAFDYIFRRSSYTWENYYYFLIYGGVTAFWLINVYDFKKLLKYWTIFAICGGCMLITDPFKHYAVSGSYMNFGSGVLPAFAACFVVFAFYKKRIITPLLIIFLLEILLYANKGASFSAIGIILIFTIYLTEDKRKRIKRVILIIGLAILMCFFAFFLLESLVGLASRLGVGSYSLSDVNQILSSGFQLNSFSVRATIWEKIWEEFKSNFIIGMGIGGFEDKYGNYAHNFFLDILITHGILVGTIIFGMIGVFIKNTISYKNKDLYVFSTIILLLWILPMMFSFTYWKMNSFWLFIIINLYFKTSKNGITNKKLQDMSEEL